MSRLDVKETSWQRGATAKKEIDVKAKERAAEKMKETETELKDKANTEEEATNEETIQKKII